MRKTGKWYRFDQLKYVAELGVDGVLEAMNELSGSLSKLTSATPSAATQTKTPSNNSAKAADIEIIDLTLDVDGDDKDCSIVSGPSNTIILASATQSFTPSKLDTVSQSTYTASVGKGLLDFFAEDESAATLPELLKCLTVEELKSLAKTMKLSNALTTVSFSIVFLMSCFLTILCSVPLL